MAVETEKVIQNEELNTKYPPGRPTHGSSHKFSVDTHGDQAARYPFNLWIDREGVSQGSIKPDPVFAAATMVAAVMRLQKRWRTR